MANPWLDPESTTYDEWVEFVAAHQLENTILEYKDPRVLKEPGGRQKLVQDISAMANTWGGLVLLGVGGKDGSYSVEAFPRAQHPTGRLRDSVVSSCLDMTWPPLLVTPCELDSSDGTKVIVVVRVPPRLESPTFFHSEGEVGCFECYVRAHGRKYRPKRTANELQWYTGIDLATDLPELQVRATRAAEARAQLLKVSRDRRSIWLRQMESPSEAGIHRSAEGNHFDLAICPLFPREPLARRVDVHSCLNTWQTALREDLPGWFDGSDTLTRFEPIGGGARLASVERKEDPVPAHWLYVEATEMGHVYCSLGLPGYTWPEKKRLEQYNAVSVGVLAMILGRVLQLARQVYATAHYPGPLSLEWNAGPDLKWMTLLDLRPPRFCTHSTWRRSGEVSFAHEDQFAEAVCKEVREALEDLAWTFRAEQSSFKHISQWVSGHVSCRLARVSDEGGGG